VLAAALVSAADLADSALAVASEAFLAAASAAAFALSFAA
jgi:hypothetical protein